MKIITIFAGLLLAAKSIAASSASAVRSKSKQQQQQQQQRPLANAMLPRRDLLREVMTIRAGQQSQDPYQQQSYYKANDNSRNSQNYEAGFANYNPPPNTGYDDQGEASVMQESVQDRHDKWRTAQMEKYANLAPEQEYNPRDEQGRMKLMSSVSKGSRAVIFFILMWRDIYLFEVADLSIKGGFRKMITRMFLTAVFLGNLAGVVTSVTSQGHSAKNRLKAILNLDKVVESTLLVWNLSRVTLFPSKYVPREIFVAGCMHAIFFLIQCQAFTRVTWDERLAPSLQQNQQQGRHQLQNSEHRGFGGQSSTEFESTTLGDLEDYSQDPQNLPGMTNSRY